MVEDIPEDFDDGAVLTGYGSTGEEVWLFKEATCLSCT